MVTVLIVYGLFLATQQPLGARVMDTVRQLGPLGRLVYRSWSCSYCLSFWISLAVWYWAALQLHPCAVLSALGTAAGVYAVDAVAHPAAIPSDHGNADATATTADRSTTLGLRDPPTSPGDGFPDR